ncbi:MAG: DUF4173 domain-containing protein [Anaerolineae bacterium]|nr:DUF4173 domain-containing protein [Anaerolineae bacterium]
MSSTATASVRTVALGVGLGLVATILTYRHAAGLGFTLYGMALLGALLAMARVQQVRPAYRNLFLYVPAVFFVIMLAVRSDWSLILLNFVTTIVAALLLIYFFTSGNAARQNILMYPIHALLTAFAVWLQPFAEVAQTAKWFSTHRTGWHGVIPVVRGLVITVPVVGVFIILLSSADEIFARAINNIFSALLPKNGYEIAIQAMFVALFSWTAIGGLSFGLLERKAKRPPTPPARPASPAGTSQSTGTDVAPELTVDDLVGATTAAPVFSLGFTESVMLLGSVCAVFTGFVAIQFVYLFGGARNIANFSYAEYVHRGFSELVIVAILTLGLALILNTVAVRKTRRNHNIVRGLNTLLILLTCIILVSAFQRLRLYELTYGFTALRLTIYVFIIWLGFIFAGFTLSMYWLPTTINVFSLTALIAVFGFVATLDVLNPDAFVAWQNLNRGDLDPLYLSTLSEEAVPALVTLVDAPEPGTRAIIRQALNAHYRSLSWYSSSDFRDFSIGRNAAFKALMSVKDKITGDGLDAAYGMNAERQLADLKAFLRKGMTIREVARQLGAPYYSMGYNNSYGAYESERTPTRGSDALFTVVYRMENNEYAQLRFHTLSGLDSVNVCPNYYYAGDCRTIPLSPASQ